MIDDFKNLKNVNVLGKIQQTLLKGGQICKLTIIDNDGNTSVGYFDGFQDGEAGSSEAQTLCSGVASQTSNRCFYDCEHDGFGQ